MLARSKLLLIISTTKTVSSLQLWDCEQQGPGQMVFITHVINSSCKGQMVCVQCYNWAISLWGTAWLKLAFHS
jgi:hypothetical protein